PVPASVLIKYNRNLTAVSFCHQLISFTGFLDRKFMRNQIFRMNVPSDQTLHQFFHTPQTGHPGTVDGLLSVNDIRARHEGTGSSLSDKCDFSPFSGRTDGQLTSRIIGACIDRTLYTFSIGHVKDLFQGILTRTEYMIDKSE